MSDYYSVLGISPGATAEEVKQAYFKLAKMHHPDKNGSPDSTARMAGINLAYETLCDSQKRGEYDLENDFAVDEEVQVEDYEEIGQESHVFGRCVKCNFVNNSGVFICSTCGYVFDPEARHGKGRDYEELDDQDAGEVLSEIIRCPRCNEVNRYSRGSCWQCGLVFEVEEVA